MWLCLNHSNFEFQVESNLNNILKYQMIWEEKVINMKFVSIIKMYNFYFSHFLI
jgi:hypothetical protein